MARPHQKSAAEIAGILKYARQHGNRKASEKYGVSMNVLQRWARERASGTLKVAEPMTRDQLLAELRAFLKKHGREFSWPEWRRFARHPGAMFRFWTNWGSFKLEAMGDTPPSGEELTVIRREQRLADELNRVKEQLRAAHREVNAAEDLRTSVFKLAAQPVVPRAWPARAPSGDGGPGTPVLFTSDFQWGETISARELDGINAFDAKIAAERYRRLIEKTIDLCFSHTVKPRYREIVYLRGGDQISGDIHQELRETNSLQSIPAVIDLVATEAWGLKQLAEKFGRVRVITVAGNHGRTTFKPTAKRAVETNYDYLSAVMLEREFAGDPRFAWQTPLSPDALFAVEGWQLLLTHGDRIGSRGGMGFVGPAATISRGMKKLADYYATLGRTIDFILCGHFHVPLELEHGWSNGSLPGYSEYARDFRARPQAPSQWLLFFHPRYGATQRWKIYLEDRVRLQKGVT